MLRHLDLRPPTRQTFYTAMFMIALHLLLASTVGETLGDTGDLSTAVVNPTFAEMILVQRNSGGRTRDLSITESTILNWQLTVHWCAAVMRAKEQDGIRKLNFPMCLPGLIDDGRSTASSPAYGYVKCTLQYIP